MPNDILEARVNQADEHQKDTSANLEALIQQNDENNPNPNLEVLINKNFQIRIWIVFIILLY